MNKVSNFLKQFSELVIKLQESLPSDFSIYDITFHIYYGKKNLTIDSRSKGYQNPIV